MGTPVLEVLTPGLLTTVQDAGRPGAVHLGVPVGGACDPWSLSLANALVGNEPRAAALEITLAGPTFRVLTDCLVGLAGADFGARVADGDRPLRPGTSRRLRRGETLALDVAAEGTGSRAYLALSGGVDVPEVLGSRSTCLVGGFGGLDGRPLRAGDVVAAGHVGVAQEREVTVADWRAPVLRVVAGPDAEALGEGLLGSLLAAHYTVSGRSDRQGLRLEGDAPRLPEAAAEMVSRGVAWGAIQLPPDGQPICLLADHQTVGGYPVPAVVATVDRPTLGQFGPGDAVSLELVSQPEARRLALAQADKWAALLAGLAQG